MRQPHPKPTRAALYLRVSTVRQAEYNVSIPDQRRQGEAFCRARQFEVAEVFVEEGASATNDRRPEFRRMIDVATKPPRPFEIILVHSFSRFFRDHIELELYVRKLARNGVKLVSMTQEIGDDPMHAMMRQIIALFDEYQSKENGKHVIRALKENARQGFWCGSTPPIGYRTVVAERRGDALKKKLEIDPNYVDLIRLIYRLALIGQDGSGPMGTKKIVSYLNARDIKTQGGGRWGVGQLYRVLTRRTYMGEHSYNKLAKGGTRNPDEDIVIVPVPAIISREDFSQVQKLLASRRFEIEPRLTPSREPLLKGLAFCGLCGGALTVRVAKGRRYRYYTCSIRSRQGPTGCHGIALAVTDLDKLVRHYVFKTMLHPRKLLRLVQPALDLRRKPFQELAEQARTARVNADEAGTRMRRIMDAIEAGVIDPKDADLADRIEQLRQVRDARRIEASEADTLRDQFAQGMIEQESLLEAAAIAHRAMRGDALSIIKFLQLALTRIEVGEKQIELIGARSWLVGAIMHVGSLAQCSSMEARQFRHCREDDVLRFQIARH